MTTDLGLPAFAVRAEKASEVLSTTANHRKSLVGIKISSIDVWLVGRMVGVCDESVEKLLKLILIREDVDASQVDSIIIEGGGEWRLLRRVGRRGPTVGVWRTRRKWLSVRRSSSLYK